MKHFKNIKALLIVLLVNVVSESVAQVNIRPYECWDETAFVSLSGHQPANYVRKDNNWEILYTLRTPHTIEELNSIGIQCNQSQLMLLEVGGLIKQEGKKWRTQIPILDEDQTNHLRKYSKEVANKIYAMTKKDFRQLMDGINAMGFQDNTASLIFSYLLDGRMWTKLVLFEDINNHPTWSGCYWLLYDARKGLSLGTNAYGKQDMIVTYGVTSEIVPSHKTMKECAYEIGQYGKINNQELVQQLLPYGVVDVDGNLTVPVIKKDNNPLKEIVNILTDKISASLKENVVPIRSQYNINSDNLTTVILYHEVMWDIIDLLIEKENLKIPKILENKNAEKYLLKNVTFYIEGGLMN